MCIEALEHYIKPEHTMLDLGCGSGILSVTGLMLGAEKCFAIDINPDAADITYQNAKVNNISKERLNVYTGDVINDSMLADLLMNEQYDCIVANIVADAIISLSKPISKYKCLKPDGVFISSGIIKDRADDVISALKNTGFKITEIKTMGEWVCVVSTSTKKRKD
jgi:ribosomal protein L11 methyltransferase